MKKIGIFYGMERDFPYTLVNKINNLKIRGVKAETGSIGLVDIDTKFPYDVVFDRVSTDIPFFGTVFKAAYTKGTKVVNNPIWNCSKDNFLDNVFTKKFNFNIPKTVVIPSKEHPPSTNSDFMQNLMYPLNWEEIFDYIGFPAYIKPVNNSNGPSFKVYNPGEFFSTYDLTGCNVIMLQEFINYDSYFICYTIGCCNTKIMNYDPLKPLHLRFSSNEPELDDSLRNDIIRFCQKMSEFYGFNFCSTEVAIKDGKPYIIEFAGKYPYIEKDVFGEDNFNWLVDNTAYYLVGLAKSKLAPDGSIYLYDNVNSKTSSIKAKKSKPKKVKKDKIKEKTH